MSAYTAVNEEALRTRRLLKDWAGEGLLTGAQYEKMERETVCEFRRTNIFLRAVLFLFTLIIVGAGLGLFFAVFLSKPTQEATGVVLLIAAALSYAAAEYAVAKGRLYRHGIEEALAFCSVGFLCAGLNLTFFHVRSLPPVPDARESLVFAAGAITSLWMWFRFRFIYAPVAAMLFVIWLPVHWTSSHAAQHLIVAAFYVAGLIAVRAVRDRERLTYLNQEYSIVEGCLWLGVYLAMNLQISTAGLAWYGFGDARSEPEVSRTFYRATWVLIWCLPPVILTRGLRGKDRFITAAGGVAAILTLVTNKPYLGWQRNTWDPMLLGVLLIGVAVFVRRWLAGGPDGIRNGFTARRLSGKDQHWLAAGSAALGMASAHSMPVHPPTSGENVRFGGGDTAGGGASSDF